MKYRKLRIAWSVAWGVAAVLLVVLWVRSYYVYDIFTWNGVSADTERGIMYLVKLEAPIGFENNTAVSGWTTAELSDVDDEGSLANMMTGRDGTRRTIETLEALGMRAVAIKMYVLLLIAAPLAITPFVRWRFSLRTLLIATTLIAVGLGAIIWITK